MGLRATWTGAIIMSMMTFPVKACAATGEQEIKRHNLHSECKHRISQIKVCDGGCTDKVLDKLATNADKLSLGGLTTSQIVQTVTMIEREGLKVVTPMTSEKLVKGYELAKDLDVVLTDAEIETIKLKSAKAIEILEFVKAADCDPRMPEKAYFIFPDKVGVKPFALMLESMKRKNRYAVGKTMMRDTGKETMVLLRPFGHVLLMQTLAWASELRDAGELRFDQPAVSERELALGQQLIDTMIGDGNFLKYHDQYQEQLGKLLEKKALNQEIKAEDETEAAPVPTDNLEAMMQAAITAVESKKSSVVVQAEEVAARAEDECHKLPEQAPKKAKRAKKA